jgi:hypothetical protein
VLASAKALGSEVARFRDAAEKAQKDWLARQPNYDTAVSQVEELEAGQDAKAPAARGLVDGVRTQVNQRRYAQASLTLDALLPKLKGIHDGYLKQRESEPDNGQQSAESTAPDEALKGSAASSAATNSKSGGADDYQALLKRVQPRMQLANQCALPSLEASKTKLNSSFKAMQASAGKNDFAAAIATGTALESALTTFETEREKARKQIKSQVNANLPTIQTEMKALTTAKSKIKDRIEALITSIAAAVKGDDETALFKAANDLDKLPELVRSLKAVEDVRKKMDGAKTEGDKKKEAKKIVDEIAKKGEIAQMPTEARNILIEAMLKGKVTGNDTTAINKIWATPTLDSAFDEVDKPVRDSIVKAYAEDPKVLEYRKNWKTMKPDEKKKAIKYLTSIPCGKNGWNVGDPVNFKFFDTPTDAKGNTSYGSYNRGTDTMSANLNDDAHARFDELLDTVAHEIGHKQQGQLIDQYRKGKLKPGDANYEEAKALALCEDYRKGHYDEFKKVYETSPEETHSRVMGSELQAEMAIKFPGGVAPP